jgi:hypothetical protein
VTQTEVERYVRERVSATGKPFLIAPAGRAPSLRAVLLFDVGLAEEPDVYALVVPTASGLELSARWAQATLWALTAVSEWVPEPPEAAAYVYEEGATDVVRRVEATALGLSLLQLALNRAGSGIVIEVVT